MAMAMAMGDCVKNYGAKRNSQYMFHRTQNQFRM